MPEREGGAENNNKQRLADMVGGMGVAVEIMRKMASEGSIANIGGPAALRIVADAVERAARMQGGAAHD